MNTVAILLCAGSGNRMRGEVEDKILTELKDQPVFNYSVLAFEQLEEISGYAIVYRDNAQREQLLDLFEDLSKKPVAWIRGGDERQESVSNALEAISSDTDFVMIHDCARPLVTPEALREVYQTMVKDKAAVLAHRVVDTIKQVDSGAEQIRQATLKNLDRKSLWAMETPQAFSWKLIQGTYRQLKEDKIKITDDTAAVIHYGYQVSLVENHLPNPKITLPGDLEVAELMLQQRPLNS